MPGKRFRVGDRVRFIVDTAFPNLRPTSVSFGRVCECTFPQDYVVCADGGELYRVYEYELQLTTSQEIVDAWRAAQVQER
jgi:hypothetical protein